MSDNTDMIYCDFSEIICYLIFNHWGERDIKINTDYYLTGYMLWVVTHIYDGGINNYDGNNSNQVKKITKTLFYEFSAIIKK